MPCFVALIGFFFPRLAMLGLWLFTDYMSRAFQTALWPLLGFIFLPFTTLAYAFGVNSNGGSISGIYLVLVVFGVLLDLGVLSGGGQEARRRRTVVRVQS
jgi:multisubunit Na+/H+ antiporter MnhG subunit